MRNYPMIFIKRQSMLKGIIYFALIVSSILACKPTKSTYRKDNTIENNNYKYIQYQTIDTYNLVLFANNQDTIELLYDFDKKEIPKEDLNLFQSLTFENRLNALFEKCNRYILSESMKNEHIKDYVEVVFDNYESYQLSTYNISKTQDLQNQNRVIQLIKVHSIYYNSKNQMTIDYSINGKIDDTYLAFSISSLGEIISMELDG